MSVIASVVMGTCGAAYILLGACMLIAGTQYRRHLNGIFTDIAWLYPSLFKFFEPQQRQPLPKKRRDSMAERGVDVDDDDEEHHHQEDNHGGGARLFTVDEEVEHQQAGGYEANSIEERLLPLPLLDPTSSDPLLQARGVAFRLLAYLLVFLGVCRLISACYWGCGYVYLGMASCVAEISVVVTELLHHRSVRLHRAMSVLLELGVLSEIYLGTAIPYCHV